MPVLRERKKRRHPLFLLVVRGITWGCNPHISNSININDTVCDSSTQHPTLHGAGGSGTVTPRSSPALLNPCSTAQCWTTGSGTRGGGGWWPLPPSDAPEPAALQSRHLGPVPRGGSWPASAQALLLSPHTNVLPGPISASIRSHQTWQEQNKTLLLWQDLVSRDPLREACPWSRCPSPASVHCGSLTPRVRAQGSPDRAARDSRYRRRSGLLSGGLGTALASSTLSLPQEHDFFFLR